MSQITTKLGDVVSLIDELKRKLAAAEARVVAAEDREAAAEHRAAEAGARATEAEDRAAEAEGRAVEAAARAVEAEDRAAEAEVRATKAEDGLASAEARAAEAENVLAATMQRKLAAEARVIELEGEISSFCALVTGDGEPSKDEACPLLEQEPATPEAVEAELVEAVTTPNDGTKASSGNATKPDKKKKKKKKAKSASQRRLLMDQDILREALHFLRRCDLETCQLVSKTLSGLVSRASDKLSLRCITYAELSSSDISISRERSADDECAVENDKFHHYNPTQWTFGDFAIRLNNTYIEEIFVIFDNVPHTSAFLRRWPSLEPKLCSVQMLRARCYCGSADRHLLNTTVAALTPQKLQVNADTVRAMNVFQAELVPVFVRHMKVIGTYQQNGPNSIPPHLPALLLNVGILTSCDVSCNDDPCSWIDAFIQRFETAAVGPNTVETFSIFWHGADLNAKPRTLRNPSRKDVAVPENGFVREDCEDYGQGDRLHYLERHCCLSIFENVPCEKKLEVYEWTVKGSVPTSVAFLFKFMEL